MAVLPMRGAARSHIGNPRPGRRRLAAFRMLRTPPSVRGSGFDGR